MTAHNAAGNRIVTSQVSTLTLLGQTIAPSLLSTAAPAVTGGSGVEGSLAISAILTIIILATALLLSLYCYKRYLHCNENPIHEFLFWELRGISPNLHIHVSVSDLYTYIPRIGPHISCRRIGRSMVGIYKSLTNT
jgi:hypothetical protein